MVRRVVSLIASSTEMVCALGLQEQLVGRSHECDYPETVRSLPVCTSPKFDIEGVAYEIDQRVKAILQEGLSVYRVDAEALASLRPDVIITQSQCEVCAVSLSDVEDAVCDWLDTRPLIVSLEPNSLADVWTDIRRVASALNVADRGQSLIQNLQGRIADIEDRTRMVHDRPSVACIEWPDPLMAAGNWTPELVELAGGKCVFGEAGAHAPMLSWESLLEVDPDIILISPCGWNIEKARTEMPSLTSHEGWSNLTAVRNSRVYLADGNQFFNRPGPRLVESLEILTEILHPEECNFGHEGHHWVAFSEQN